MICTPVKATLPEYCYPFRQLCAAPHLHPSQGEQFPLQPTECSKNLLNNKCNPSLLSFCHDHFDYLFTYFLDMFLSFLRIFLEM